MNFCSLISKVYPLRSYLSRMAEKKWLIVVGGPTASGKTGFAIRLARRFQTEILSGDSRQFFREMGIGTAKPSEKELAAAPHHFINHLSIRQEYHVGAYEKEALHRLEEIFQNHHIAILVGGSGLYLKALCEGMDEFPEILPAVRQSVEDLYTTAGLEGLQAAVQEVDPLYFSEVDSQNPHRLIRALSVYRASGRPFSSFRQKKRKSRFFTPVYLQMHWPRVHLYERIDRRVDLMIEQGLLEEVKGLLPYREHRALQTVGYQEIFEFLDGKIKWNEAVELIKRNTRRYAKRQLTWMRRDGFWKHFHPNDWRLALNYLELLFQNKWSWAVHQPPLVLFNRPAAAFLEESAKMHVLYAGDKPQAAIVQYSFKKFECLERPLYRPDISSEAKKYFLDETLRRLEEAAAYFFIEKEYGSFLQKQGFNKIENQLPSSIEKLALREKNDNLEIYYRGRSEITNHRKRYRLV